MRFKIFTCSLLLTVSFSCFADTIVVGMNAWAPFRFIKDEKVSGIDHELWKRIGKALDIEVEYLQCPWKRCLKLMQDGLIDAMGGLAYREERAAYITYTTPHYYTCSTQLYVKKSYGNTVKDHTDLYWMRVGMVSGSAYYEAFDNDSKIKKMPVAQESILPELLIKQRIDTFIGTDCQVDYELKASGQDQHIDKSTFKPDNSVKLYIGLSSKSAWVKRVDTLNAALKEITDANFEANAIGYYMESTGQQLKHTKK